MFFLSFFFGLGDLRNLPRRIVGVVLMRYRSSLSPSLPNVGVIVIGSVSGADAGVGAGVVHRKGKRATFTYLRNDTQRTRLKDTLSIMVSYQQVPVPD